MSAKDKKDAALEAILDHLLEKGLEDTGIRSLARSAGISDRMLIYYFGSKEALITEALDALSERTSLGLAMLIDDGRHDADAIMAVLDGAMEIPQFENAMKLFLEVAARGARGIEPYRSSARTTIAFWMAWLEDRLEEVPGGPTPYEHLVNVEGRILLSLIERG
jgi:AcrR family transcriptional regulator